LIAILLAAQLAAAQAQPPKGPTPQQRLAAIRAQCLGFLPIAPDDLVPGVECVIREDADVFAEMALTAARKTAADAAHARMRQAAAEKAESEEVTKKIIAIDDEMLAALGASVERLGEPEFLPVDIDTAKVYPVQALIGQINGIAVVKCWVDANGAMQNCRVTVVGPPDVGFEEAGPRVAALRKIKPVTLNRARIADVPVTFPVEFRLFE